MIRGGTTGGCIFGVVSTLLPIDAVSEEVIGLVVLGVWFVLLVCFVLVFTVGLVGFEGSSG